MKQYTMISKIDMVKELSFLEIELSLTQQHIGLEVVKEIREKLLKEISEGGGESEVSIANTMLLLITRVTLMVEKNNA